MRWSSNCLIAEWFIRAVMNPAYPAIMAKDRELFALWLANAFPKAGGWALPGGHWRATSVAIPGSKRAKDSFAQPHTRQSMLISRQPSADIGLGWGHVGSCWVY